MFTHLFFCSCRGAKVPTKSEPEEEKHKFPTHNPNDKESSPFPSLPTDQDSGKLKIPKADSGSEPESSDESKIIDELFDNDPRFGIPDEIESVESSNSIQKNILYTSKKGFVADMDKKETKFLGEGMISVPDDKISLKAYRIRFNWDNKLMKATGKKDPKDKKNILAPPLLQYEDDIYLAKRVLYNTESEKAFANGIISPQKEGIIRAGKLKKTNDEHFYIKDGSFSTCRLENPHYKIIAPKAKVIKDDRVITGPFWLQFGNVPTPLGFVYSAFRITKKRESGVLFPDFGLKSVKGFYLNDFGYYFAINKYLGLAFQGGFDSESGDTYIKIPFEYNNRYKYGGIVDYNLQMEQFRDTHILTWKHETKYKKGGKFTSDIMIRHEVADDYYLKNSSDKKSDSSTNSDINYSRKDIFGIPYSLNIGLHHDKKFGRRVKDIYGHDKDKDEMSNEEKESELDRTRIIMPSVTLNSVPFYLFNPFGTFSSNVITKTNVTHSVEFKYEKSKIPDFWKFIKGMPKSLSEGKKEGDTHYGIMQKVPLSTTATIFKHFQLTPNFTWTERWYFEKFEYEYDDTKKEVVAKKVTPGFYRVGEYNMGAGLETNLEARYYFKKNSRLEALRHKMTPGLSFTFSPGFGQERLGYFQKEFNYYDKKIETKYAFDNIYGEPPPNAQAILGMSIKNILELKVKEDDMGEGKKNSKIIKILKSFDVKSGYDFLAEKYKLKNIEFEASTSLFDDHVNLKVTTQVDPYIYKVVDGEMEKIDDYAWNYGKKLGELRKATFDAEFILKPEEEKEESFVIKDRADRYVDFDIPWNLRANYHIAYHKESYLEVSERLKKEQKTRLLDPNKKIEPYDRITEHNIRFDGEISLTKKWKLSTSVLYNIKKKKFEDPTIGIFRDLHCWELRINWRPLYYKESLEFMLRVKADILKYIKYKSRGKM